MAKAKEAKNSNKTKTQTYKNYIGGEWLTSPATAVAPVFNP